MDYSILRIDQAIALHAKESPHRLALVVDNECLNYAQLDEKIALMSQQLGLLQGRAIPFRAHACYDTIVRYFAIHRSGGVAVPLDKDMPEGLYQTLSQRIPLTSCPQGTADVLFTTGTTGCPKGVMISHQAIMANADNLIEAQGYEPTLTFVVNGPLNHIGSLSKLYPTFLVGGTVRVVDGVRDMDYFLETLRASGSAPVATFLVPANIRMLVTFAAEALSELNGHIEFIETGAAPIAQADMMRLCQLLPSARLYNTYASTETGIIATHNFNAGYCKAGCLGHPMRHSSLRILSDGRVACGGATLMTGYWNDPTATESLLHNGEIFTNDLGRIDSDGRLHLSGRGDDVINVGGYKVAPTEVENVAQTFPAVADCICIPFQHPIIGTTLRLLVTTSYPNLDIRALHQWLKLRLEPHKVPQDIRLVDHIERTFNGKLNRKAYL